MSNCLQIYFPSTTRVENVAIALGALCGVPLRKGTWKSSPVTGRAFDFVEAPGVKVVHTSDASPEFLHINLPTRQFNYWMEADGDRECGGAAAACRYMSMGSTAFNIAVARKLVETFGGRLIYQDVHDNSYGRPNFRRPVYKNNAANDGEAWYALQRRLAALKPLTQKDVEKCAKWAGYDYDPDKWDDNTLY